jgi:hypothetical protein
LCGIACLRAVDTPVVTDETVDVHKPVDVDHHGDDRFTVSHLPELVQVPESADWSASPVRLPRPGPDAS